MVASKIRLDIQESRVKEEGKVGKEIESNQDSQYAIIVRRLATSKEIVVPKCKTKRGRQVSKRKEKGLIDPELPPIRPSTQIFVRKAVCHWKDPNFERPLEVIDSSPTAVRITERKAWIHRSDIRVDPAPPKN
ncbi:hypothetical protein NDU88_006350 [Pleurodeles waltl]|uniref:Uncharacterized protein n=1 Tax=Pleurodeles waltl TaxID=8319 RepID=A0AAV7TD87_PLEWA|nr:hypothetical protein NDU88_006350 [Pleurodeles waltl]